MARTVAHDLRTIPNMLSVSRVFIISVAVTLWMLEIYLPAVIIGIIAGATDYLDGYLARKLGQTTKLGEVLDLFSDLYFEAAAILMLITHPDGAPAWVLFVYLVREFWVTTIRRFVASYQLNIASSFLGKLKTNFLGWCFAAYFFHLGGVFPEPIHTAMLYIGYTGLYGGLFWSYVSGWQYTRQFIDLYPQALARAEERGEIPPAP